MMPVSAIAPYREPEILRTYRVPGGGEVRLEALSPVFDGAPIVRLVADFKVGQQGAHTIESYVQVPYRGYEQLGADADATIAIEVERLMRRIARRRAAAGTT